MAEAHAAKQIVALLSVSLHTYTKLIHAAVEQGIASVSLSVWRQSVLSTDDDHPP